MTQAQEYNSCKLQIRIPIPLKQALDNEARKMQVTPAHALRLAITQFLDLPPSAAKFKQPLPKELKLENANSRRRKATAALRYLAKTDPELLLRLAGEQEKAS